MRLHRRTTRMSSVVRFIIAGCLNTAVSYASFVICYSSLSTLKGLNAVAISVLVSLLAGIITSYNLQKYFVWRPYDNSGNRRSTVVLRKNIEAAHEVNKKLVQKIVYAAYYLFLAWTNIILVEFIERKAGIDPRIAQAGFSIIGAAFSYFVLRFLFNNKMR